MSPASTATLHIPADNIVQDWFWWTSTGEFKWNKNYPDPQKMVDTLHRENFHLMVSIWPFFYPGTATYADMDKRGYLFEKTKVPSFHPQGMAVYDATNPEARKYYWGLVNQVAVQARRRCLVDGHHRTRDRGQRRQRDAAPQAGDRQRHALCEHLSTAGYQRRLRRPTRCLEPEARLHPLPLRVSPDRSATA